VFFCELNGLVTIFGDHQAVSRSLQHESEHLPQAGFILG
jgi:hypothetical protein